jgi:uncharacterized protein
VRRGLREGGASNAAPPPLATLLEELARPAPQSPLPLAGPLSPAFFGIIPTRRCNLACRYCGFGAASAPRDSLDPSFAARAVDVFADLTASRGRSLLEIHFFGGEPFISEEVVDVVVHRARARAGALGLATRFEAATNGVMDDRRAHFVGDFFDTIVLSLDGPREIQDRNRPSPAGGSFERVLRTARILSSSSVELALRICVTQESVGVLEDAVTWMCEDLAPDIVNFETLKPTSESEAAGLAPPDPLEFAAACVRASRIASRHGVQPIYAASTAAAPRVSFCPVGRDTLILSPDGRLSGCYLLPEEWQRAGLDLDVGRMEPSGQLAVDIERIEHLRTWVAEKPRCQACFCRATCAGGCHVAHALGGSTQDSFCQSTRLIAACSLLDEMGESARADALLADRGAMTTLARTVDDRILGS